MSTPASLVADRLVHAPAQRRDQPAALVHLLDHVGRRRAERVRDQPHLRVLERDLDLRRRGGRGPAEQLARAVLGRQLGHAVVGEQLRGELAVLQRDHRAQVLLELARVHLAHALVLLRDHQIDAVGLVADVLVDPAALDLELLGREADRAEHAEAARLRDRGDHVAAVREGEDRELDAEALAEIGVHGGSSKAGPRSYCRMARVPLSSESVGVSGEPLQSSVDARWTMAYAAGLGDARAAYLDTRARPDVLAHPLFPVCFEWPAFLSTRHLPVGEA